ncbi:MAG: hypothetical protein IPM64_10775 [Phycisphaerales bacterium]|nr:hypothetical protein [Phycisphaerales bacterium]
MPSDPNNSHAALTKEGLLERLHAAFDCAKYSGEADALFDLAGERVFFREDGDIGPVLDEADRVSHWSEFSPGLFIGQMMVVCGGTRSFPYFLAAVMYQGLLDYEFLQDAADGLLYRLNPSKHCADFSAGLDALTPAQHDVFRDFIIYYFRKGHFWGRDALWAAPVLGVPVSALAKESCSSE